ncbi:MAG: hypothetical protein MZU97_12940 [Bacillus subtilis]|nr:hypothetical protein [Bacillus subtilis]
MEGYYHEKILAIVFAAFALIALAGLQRHRRRDVPTPRRTSSASKPSPRPDCMAGTLGTELGLSPAAFLHACCLRRPPTDTPDRRHRYRRRRRDSPKSTSTSR